jgi:GntR family transcriptional regulator/MocR family aminotransferase
MPSRTAAAAAAPSAALPLTLPPLARDGAASLQAQLYDALRGAVLDGRLPVGARLPATRELAADLGVSRNTVVGAYARLTAEGYLDSRVGDGAYVARALPEALLQARRAIGAPPAGSRAALSERGRRLVANPVSPAPTGRDGGPLAFRVAMPAPDAFPEREWTRLVEHRLRRPADWLGYGDPAGYRPLREAIAAYLGAVRGVRCDPGQVVVTGGSQQALDLAARLLLDPGDAVALEDPGYPGARAVLLAAGARLQPVPVDAEGLIVGSAQGSALGGARLIYVTPSHQFPLGSTMSLRRRLALLDHAARAGAWVLEDDYDGEYRYAGRPLPALQGLDDAGRVIYLGTFSKVLAPGLRLGYVVAPPALTDAFVAARALTDRGSPGLEQAVLADFVAGGGFARHVRRTRLLYAERQHTLVEAARRDLGGLLEVRPAAAGMHLVGRLPAAANDRLVWGRLADAGVSSMPLSACALAEPPFPGLVLGYAAASPDELREGVRRLRAVLASSPAVAIRALD